MAFKRICVGIVLTVSSLVLLQGQSLSERDSVRQTTFRFAGYGKLDVITSRYYGGEPAPESSIRDLHYPAGIPIGGELKGYDTELHARESRLSFDVNTKLLGSPASVYMEMDFLFSVAGNERVSNSYNPRLRHFYFTWKNFVFGQTWTTFMTPESIPDGIIFVGGADGLTFVRQALIRFNYKNWSFGFENPETTVLAYQQDGLITSSGGFPDLVAKYSFSGDWGIIGIAGLLRNLKYAKSDGERDNAITFGLNISGKIKTGKRDDLRFMFATGEGIGRYLAFQFLTGAVLDATEDLQTIGAVNGLVSYTHFWAPKWRSNLTYSFIYAEDQSRYSGGFANQLATSGSVSILYSPVPQLQFGFQGLYAYRRIESGIDGSMLRLQISAKYSFGFEMTVDHGVRE